MPVTPSPLRYPGGKTALFKLADSLLKKNGLGKSTYAEPFAGGGGLALSLLFEGAVRRIVLNDIDAGIYSFWDAVLNHNEQFVDMIEHTPVTMAEWHRQREVYRTAGQDPSLELGFATFFLNRTNRSGVIKGGVIGGLEQSGDYLLDCRYPTDSLVEKIRRIARYRNSISIHQEDGLDFLTGMSTRNDRVVYFIDPPYFRKGSGLYTNFYTPEDHSALARTISGLEQPWVLTYDFTPEIQELYPDFAQYAFNLNYSASIKRVGTELLITSPGMSVEGLPELRSISAAESTLLVS
ncbi:DNA adenine methylase [Glaciihabitans sp. dw_435]|uniref:DNA adenine methylase n=1 Tax=Glaciihabitans sp. dw_435 TaxID=2720081 RepID=UPI001BD6A2B8|nr:DNA adenine methylase [Glaciihabitans sp. dw_435]